MRFKCAWTKTREHSGGVGERAKKRKWKVNGGNYVVE